MIFRPFRHSYRLDVSAESRQFGLMTRPDTDLTLDRSHSTGLGVVAQDVEEFVLIHLKFGGGFDVLEVGDGASPSKGGSRVGISRVGTEQLPTSSHRIAQQRLDLFFVQIVSVLHISVLHEMSVDGIWDFRRSVIPLDVDDDGIPLGEAEILDGTYEVGLVRPVRI